jgi:hypothetical protein
MVYNVVQRKCCQTLYVIKTRSQKRNLIIKLQNLLICKSRILSNKNNPGNYLDNFSVIQIID